MFHSVLEIDIGKLANIKNTYPGFVSKICILGLYMYGYYQVWLSYI